MRIPSDSHSGCSFSKSIMFVAAKYNTGVRFSDSDIDFRRLIGDGRTAPDANQLSVSATQKFGSECVVITWVGVITNSSCVVYSVPVVVRWFIISELSTNVSKLDSGVLDSGVGSDSVSGVSKFISVNVGKSVNTGDSSGISMSKSVGKGSVSGSVFWEEMLGVSVACIAGCLSMELKIDV